MGQPLVWCGPSRSISFFSQRWKVSSCGWQMNGWTGGVDTVLFGTMKLEKGPTRWISESAHVPLQGYNGRATAIWQTPWESPCVSLGAETQGKFRRTASAKIRNRFSEFQNVKENRRFWFLRFFLSWYVYPFFWWIFHFILATLCLIAQHNCWTHGGGRSTSTRWNTKSEKLQMLSRMPQVASSWAWEMVGRSLGNPGNPGGKA